MSVVVQLRGGLGNQLFQYSAGYALTQRLGENLLIDLGLLPRSTWVRDGVRRWPEQISSFEHVGTLTWPNSANNALSRFRGSTAGFERGLGDKGLLRFVSSSLYAREANESASEFWRLKSNSRINAYCNGPAFFAGFENEIRSQIRKIVLPSAWFEEEVERVRNERPIILHVRWGDYLNLKHIYGELTISYYQRAVELIRETVGDRPLWLSSDDETGSSNFLSGKIPVEKVMLPPEGTRPIEVLNIMGEASGLVAANSSFSWWGAFIGAKDEQFRAVFPRPLFANSGPAEPRDWLLPAWIQIGR